MNLDPNRLARRCLLVLAITAPASLLLLLSWGFRWHILGARPTLALMLYLTMLLVSVAAVAVACLASCHRAIHQAFAMGLRTGAEKAAQGGPSGADLRVVE